MMDKLIQANQVADGELNEAEAKTLLTQDPSLAAEIEWAKSIKSQLKTKCTTTPCQETWKSAMARLDAIDKTKKADTFVGRYAWALCGLFFVGILSAALLNRINPSRQLTETQVAGLFNSFRPQASRVAPGEQIAPLPGAPALFLKPQHKVKLMENGFVDGHSAVRLQIDDSRGGFTAVLVASATGVEGFMPQNTFRLGIINNQRSVTIRHGEGLLIVMGERGFDDLQEAAIALISSR